MILKLHWQLLMPHYKNGYVRTTEADYNERKSNKTLVIEELAKLDPNIQRKM